MSEQLQSRYERQMAYWLFACASVIIVMILLGGVTRLTHSGLSMVEWKPLVGVKNAASWNSTSVSASPGTTGASSPIVISCANAREQPPHSTSSTTMAAQSLRSVLRGWSAHTCQAGSISWPEAFTQPTGLLYLRAATPAIHPPALQPAVGEVD